MSKDKAGKAPKVVKGDLPSDNKPAKQPKKAAKTNKTKPDRDAYGNRLGTQAAVINAAVTKKPKTARQIADETKLSASRVRNHLLWLLHRNHIKRTKDGFVLTK